MRTRIVLVTSVVIAVVAGFTAIADESVGVAIAIDSEVCGWQPAGVYVQSGDLILVQAFGTVRHWASLDDSEEERCGPDGSPGACDQDEPSCLAPGLGNNALVGRIGRTGEPFYVGFSFAAIANDTGELFLGMNETVSMGGCADNLGSWTTIVEVLPPELAEISIFSVDSKDCGWQMSPICVSTNSVLAIFARGRVRHWMSQDESEVHLCGPDGTPGACDHVDQSCCLAPGLGNNALIARIGTGEPFYVGISSVMIPTLDGGLQLAMNETSHCGGCLDNDGAWEVRIASYTRASTSCEYATSVDSEVCDWQPTGIVIPESAQVHIEASGLVRHWLSIDGSEEERCGPEGSPGACDTEEPTCLAPGLGNNALVAKIGVSGEPFFVGLGMTLLAHHAGELFLAMNETAFAGGCADNSGSWDVRVMIQDRGSRGSSD